MSSRIFSLGELIIDMIGTDKKNLRDGKVFEKNAGGAPANVCAVAGTLGADTYFMGEVGVDNFGTFLEETMNGFGVDTSMVVHEGNTTLAFASVDENGERDFMFLRDADDKYDFRNIKTDMISSNDILHFGSAMGLLGVTLKKTYIDFFYFGAERRCFLSFDPNYRFALVTDDQLIRYRKDCITFIKRSDLVKMSEEELRILTDIEDVYEAARVINDLGTRVCIITLGKKGALLSMEGQQVVIPTPEVKVVDTTGAGDAFMGGVLFNLTLRDDKKSLSFDDWQDIVKFANVVGAISTTKYGAMQALPSLSEVNAYLK